MSKLAYAVTSLFFIEFALWLFAGSEISNTTLFGLVSHPENFLTNPLYLAITAAIAVFTVAQIIPGNIFQINIYGIYAGIAAVLLSFLAVIVHLYLFILGETSGIGGSAFAFPIAAIIIGPLMIFYTLSIIEWVRAN